MQKRRTGVSGWRGPSSEARTGMRPLMEGQATGFYPAHPPIGRLSAQNRAGRRHTTRRHRRCALGAQEAWGPSSSVMLICRWQRETGIPAWGPGTGRSASFRLKRASRLSSSPPPLPLFISVFVCGDCSSAFLRFAVLKLSIGSLLNNIPFLSSPPVEAWRERIAPRIPRLAPICREASRHHGRPVRRGYCSDSVSVTCYGAAPTRPAPDVV